LVIDDSRSGVDGSPAHEEVAADPTVGSQAEAGDTADGEVLARTDVDARRRPPWPRLAGMAVLVVLIGVLLASQLYLIATLGNTRGELEATRADLANVEVEINDVASTIDDLAADVETLGTVTERLAVPGVSTLPEGHLPRFVQGQQDTAVGMKLGPLAGPDAYSGAPAVIDPADGVKRLWIVWAHWCPYCQQELPELSSMYADLVATYPGIDLASVTTSIDPSQGNPLDAYLAEQQFPFAVLVDDQLDLAAQLGVSAFPFWLVTDGDGTVLLRATGYLDPDRVRTLASTLDEYGT